jgi:hypothetical protein
MIVRTWRAARQSMGDLKEADVRAALERLDPLWDELFPAEQARIVQLLVERVDVSPDGADIRLRTEGLTNLVTELRAIVRKGKNSGRGLIPNSICRSAPIVLSMISVKCAPCSQRCETL